MPRGSPNRRDVVKEGGLKPHQLPGTAGSFSSTPVLYETQEQHHRSTEVGQPNSSDLYKQNGGNPLTSPVQSGRLSVGLEPATEHISICGAPAREREHSGRPGVEDNERQMRLDVEPSCFQSNPISDGSMHNRPICITPYEATSKVLQLEARPRGGGDRCFQPRLVHCEGLRQSSLVSDSSLPLADKTTDGESGGNHSIVEYAALVSNHSGSTGGLPSPPASKNRPGNSSHRSRVHNEAGSARVNCLAHLRESFTSQGISTSASDLLLSSWRTKTKSNYNSLFAKWADWCQQRDRNPTSGPIKDIINFLAELYNRGYQYRSLNTYRSAISAVHSEVDDYPVGQHPLVSRMLKGVFNERPPLPRYSTFWDVGVVLRYLKQLGSNDSLSLRLLTFKSVMLLALARPSRSMDLSKLDIQSRTYTSAGLTFKAQHLSKQSRPSKPLTDFFYPRFPDDTDVCPVVTIQAYERRTLEFRTPISDTGKTSLFLSWIGKHDPVSGSTIARWLKTCLQDRYWGI